MKVCHVISSYWPVIGGAERATERLCSELSRQATEVVVLTRYRGSGPRSEVREGVRVRRLGIATSSKLGALSFGLHCILLLLSRLRNFPIVHVHSPDTPFLVGLVAKAFMRRRLFVTVHGDPRAIITGRGWTGPLRMWLLRHLGDIVVAPGPWIAQELVIEGVVQDRVAVLPHGLDTRVFRPPTTEDRARARARLSIERHTLVYLYVGRLVAVKGVDILLRAWSGLNGSTKRLLLLVGDGPERQALLKLRDDYGTDGVRFDGPSANVLDYLHAADVFVFPSRQEGQSVALLEAIAAGLPVVATDIPANRAVVQEATTGLLVPVDNSRELSAALAKMSDESLRQALASTAARDSLRSHALEGIAHAYQALYASSSKLV